MTHLTKGWIAMVDGNPDHETFSDSYERTKEITESRQGEIQILEVDVRSNTEMDLERFSSYLSKVVLRHLGDLREQIAGATSEAARSCYQDRYDASLKIYVDEIMSTVLRR